MLALGMAFLAQPKLLMIDELSLGLAPVVVEQLLPAGARASATTGTTVILVEQSVNLALTVAETAYFMEKGEIRFHGPDRRAPRPPRRAPLGVPRRGGLERGPALGGGDRRPRPPAWPARPGAER